MSDDLTSQLLRSAVARNLTALELFPKEWIREVGDRIKEPPKRDWFHQCEMAFLWHRTGLLSKKQVRKLLGDRCGNPVTYWELDKMIERGSKIHARRADFAA